MVRESNGVLYELARDLISGHMALLSSQLWQERDKPDRNDALCGAIQAQSTRLFIERDSLSSSDRATLEACIRRYAKSPSGAEQAIAAVDELYSAKDK